MSAPARGNALMVVHSYCPADPRVRREAEALADAGFGVDVLCLRDAGEAASETLGGVRYLRFPLRRRRGGPLRYAFEYAVLLAAGLATTIVLHGFRRYRLVQAHNMPDFLVFCGVVPWLTGVPLLLDLHDPIPELYMSKFGLERRAALIRALTFVEGVCVRFADHCLAATGAFRRRLVERGRDAERVTVLLNAPDPRLFRPRPRGEGAGRPPVVLFHGTVTARSGVDVAIRAAERVRAAGTGLALVILGDGDRLPEIRRLAAEGDRATWIDVRGKVPLERVPEAVAACDLGLVPNRPGAFSDLALPTRVLEYLAMERPVLVARSPAVEEVFGGDGVLYFEPGDEEDLARALGEAIADPARLAGAVEAGRRVASRLGWERERAVYLEVVDRLVARASSPVPATSAR